MTTKSNKDYPALECPICERVCKPRSLNKDGSVSYRCEPNQEKHANAYSWKIAEDGSLID